MMNGRRPLRALFSHTVLVCLGATMLLPFLWMVTTSLKSESEVFQRHHLPQAVHLGRDGEQLRTQDGRPLASAVRRADDPTQLARGGPLVLRIGNPDMQQGSKGDRARTAAGENLSDDLGLPVLNGMVMTDQGRLAALGGVARFRDPRVMARYAEPVLVPRDLDDGANEARARAWFSRYAAHWERMVAVRWKGLVPLVLSEQLRDDWAAMSGRSEPAAINGRALRDPHAPGVAVHYQYKDLSWSEIGAPVRDNRMPTAIVDASGTPVPYEAPFPLFRSADDPLKDGDGRTLLAFVGDETRPRAVLGRELAITTSVRLLWSNYQTVLADPQIKLSLFAWNSLFISICVVALQLLTSSLAAFAFARMEWPGRDRVFLIYLATLMIPGVVTQIPSYLILQQLGWLNSFYGLIVPAAASAYGTFMLRQYMLTLPRSLEEAARIDGAGLLRIWWSITLPLCRPALITLAIFTFVTTWQSFTWPLIVAPAEAVRVLPVALKNFHDEQTTAYTLLMAASLVMMTPMVLLFVFGQKYFVRGIQIGAVKG